MGHCATLETFVLFLDITATDRPHLRDELLLQLGVERRVEEQREMRQKTKSTCYLARETGLGGIVKRRTAVHVIVGTHKEPGFHRKPTAHLAREHSHSQISTLLHLRKPELLVFALLDFLQAEKVAISGIELVNESVSAIGPLESPQRALRVKVWLAVDVGQHVVRGDVDGDTDGSINRRDGDPLARRGVSRRWG